MYACPHSCFPCFRGSGKKQLTWADLDNIVYLPPPARDGPRSPDIHLSSTTSNPYFDHSAYAQVGRMNIGEDIMVIHDDISLYAVFDGHRGRQASGHCQIHLKEYLLENFDDNINVEKNVLGVESHEVAKDIMTKTFRNLHERGRGSEAGKIGRAGCTITVLWLYKLLSDENEDIYFMVANAGDGRCVLGKSPMGSKAVAERMSVDHRASYQPEIDRVTAAGGQVFMGYLGSALQVTRGIGDYEFEKHGYIPDPQIPNQPRRLLPDDNLFFVISSDGIFDGMKDQEVIDLVDEELKQNGIKDTSKKLVETAAIHSGDDLTCVILFIKR